ncbi:MAG: class I SAM-dependent methyltransferase [Aphanothece sp. CMT-3BRIN-NPC111]|jgi:predicted O-methyltransferase YrrM|nr:class I SAM-dependent methyltransferase [Aphanothece sp. CMT-3BRIN-NPC111]
MNSILEEIFITGQVQSAQGELLQVHSHIPREAGELLQDILAELKPKVTLEVGLAYGISALFICEELIKTPGSRHIIIDPYQTSAWKDIGLHNLKKAGYQKIIDFYNKPSHIIIPNLEDRGIKIDFAFIDGMHTFDHVLVDFFCIDKLLRVGGVIVFDDTHIPSLKKVCRFVALNRSYSVFKCLTTQKEFQRSMPKFVKLGLAAGRIPTLRCIAFKKDLEDRRDWNFHSDF